MAHSKQQGADAPVKSLTAFMQEKERAQCLVCHLPDPIRSQLGPVATRRGYSRADQIAWLHSIGFEKITVELYQRHFNARHEEKAS